VKIYKISSRLVIVPRHFFTLSKRSKSHHLERAPSRASKSTRFCNMQSSLTRSSFISRQFQSSFCASSKRQSTNKSSSSSSSRKSSFVTKAGADEDELMQKLMAMIGGGAPVGRPTKGQMVAKENAIKGRDSEMRVTEEHYVLVRVNETSSTSSSSSSSSSFGERRQAAYR